MYFPILQFISVHCMTICFVLHVGLIGKTPKKKWLYRHKTATDFLSYWGLTHHRWAVTDLSPVLNMVYGLQRQTLTWDLIDFSKRQQSPVFVCMSCYPTDTTPDSPVLPQWQLLLTTKRVAMAATSMEEERSRWCTLKDICLQVAASWT